LIVVAITHALASTAKANDIQGICFFNTEKLPCTVSTDLYTLNVLWVGGNTMEARAGVRKID